MVRTDSFTVLHAEGEEMAGYLSFDIDAGDNERSKKISLAAFINAKMRFELFRLKQFFVTESRLFQDLGLQVEPDKLLCFLSLNNNFWPLLVHRDRQSGFLRGK